MIGTGIETAEVLLFGEGGFDELPEIIHGDDDTSLKFQKFINHLEAILIDLIQLLSLVSLLGELIKMTLRIGTSHISREYQVVSNLVGHFNFARIIYLASSQ
ncbi:unnamed protein product [Musa hybrid cultivar]